MMALCFVCSFMVKGADTSTAILDDNIRSLRVYSVGDNMSTGLPVVVMNTPDAVVIEFDELTDDRRYLRYELIHCDADWQPSRLAYIEYLDGFNEGTIEDYSYSRGTIVQYVHYRLTLPNEDIRLKVSGNYMVRIYDESDPELTLVRVRFGVSEGSAIISGGVTSRTDVDYNRSHQQLSIDVDVDRSPVSDMYNDVIMVISQNGREDNSRVLTKPLRTSGRHIIYEHLKPLIFEAGNEYRRFETVSNLWNGMNVAAIEYHAPYYNHYLVTDVPRVTTDYLYDKTLHGGYLVREYNAGDSDSEADYVVVHFSLEMPEVQGADIFIDSDVFARKFNPESRMVYNRLTGCYERAVLLKQGAYSYQYLTVPSGQSAGVTATVEGDRYQTDNMYEILVYTRVPGERYDRLIGHSRIYCFD